MSSLTISLVIVYLLCFIVRMWSLRVAWMSPVIHGDRYFLGVAVAGDFYRNHGRRLLRHYRTLLVVPYAAELCCFLFLLTAGELDHLILLMLAGGAAAVVTTLVSGRIFRQRARRFAVHREETAASGFALPLEARRLAGYTNPAVEAGLAVGNVVSLVLLALWHRDAGANFWWTFRLPLLLVYVQIGFLLIKHALVEWRTAMPLDEAEDYLDFREQTRRFFTEMCDWLRAHSVAFLASYTALIILGTAQKDMRVRWAIFLPWTTMLILMTVRLIGTSDRLRAYGSRLKPLCVPRVPSRATGHFYYNPDDPALFVRGPFWFTLNFANRKTYLYASYAIGLVAIVAAAAQH